MKLLRFLFSVPQDDKVTEKAMTRILISTICSLLLSMTCLVSTTWAWYTVNVTSENNVIKIGNWTQTTQPDKTVETIVETTAETTEETTAETTVETTEETTEETTAETTEETTIETTEETVAETTEEQTTEESTTETVEETTAGIE